MLTNFNIFGFGDLKLVFLQIGWSYLDNSGSAAKSVCVLTLPQGCINYNSIQVPAPSARRRTLRSITQ